MNDRRYLLDTIKALNKLKQQLKSTHEKMLAKAFIKVNSHADINYVLQNYTKSDLIAIGKCLGLSCISTLKKPDLTFTINRYITDSLETLMKRLTENEYKLIKLIIRNHGKILFCDKYADSALYLRKLGLISLILIDERRFIVIPDDILNEINYLANSIEVYNRIKLNENVNKLLKGMLFYYGVLDMSTACQLINTYLQKDTVDMLYIVSIICENYWKDYGVFICDDYLCYDYIDDYQYIAKQQSSATSIGYRNFSKSELIAASQNNLLCFNKYDISFISYLVANYEISKEEAEELTAEIKLDIKNCYDFKEILHDITDYFMTNNSEQLNELASMVKDLYDNCNQWVLKGFTVKEIHKLNFQSTSYIKNKFKTYNESVQKNNLD